MKIQYQKKFFLEPENILSYHQKFENKEVFLEIGIYSDKFKEYQKNLFNDFYSDILDILEKSELFLDFKKSLESKIKKFNTQLKVFQEKTNIENKIEIRGNLQIVYDNNYLSTLIGETTIIIFRNNKLEIVVPNEVEEDDKIDIFSEIIEGELENNDEIISIACNIYNYLTDKEIKELVNYENIIDTLEDILSVRIEKKEIGFISSLKVEIEKIVINNKKELNFNNYKKFFQKNKYVIGISLGLLIILFVLVSIFSYLAKDNNKTIVKLGEKQIELDLRSIQREIKNFEKMTNSNNIEKQKKYKQIMAELDLYEKSGIQELKIKELKKKMEQNYYKGFHINIITQNDGILDKVYSLDKNDIEKLGNLKGIVKSRGFLNIYGEKGVKVNIINDKIKGVIHNLSIPISIKSCIAKLISDGNDGGLYCVMSNNDIYKFSKLGASIIKNRTNSWPNHIIALGTYGKSRLYLLTLDKNLNSKGIFIKRYTFGNRTFVNPINYVIKNSELTKGIFTGSSLAIDGSFLIWGKNGLLQAYQKRGTNYDIRIVKGWEQGIINKDKDLKGKVKVISFINSKYVYLFDDNTKSLIVYVSKYKNTDGGKYSYQLTYDYKIKLSLDDENVIDITVDNKNSKPTAYVLTDKNIYKIDLNQFTD